MSESIKQRINAIPDNLTGRELKKVLDAILVDMTALRTSITAVTAKLDADAGVTDTNYASTCNPAALTTIS